MKKKTSRYNACGPCRYATNLVHNQANLEEKADWRRLGEPSLKPAQVRMRSATGDDIGVFGSFVVRRCEDKLVELTALVTTRATKFLCSATKLVSARCSIEMKPIQFCLAPQGRRKHTASKCVIS